MIVEWENLPHYMKNDRVKPYYKELRRKVFSLIAKRIFDVLLSLFLLIILLPVILLIAIIIKIDSPGKVFFKQVRVTQYGRKFKILKFRTMVQEAQKLGPNITSGRDLRITRAGKFIRKFRFDEFPQLINILIGDMSFVGTRPEVPSYVDCYTDEMFATLLLPAGVTSLTSIKFKNEAEMLSTFEDIKVAYVNIILPQKMKTNLEYIKEFNLFYDFKIIFLTVLAVIKKD